LNHSVLPEELVGTHDAADRVASKIGQAVLVECC
jgi:hypothetical protein